MKEAENKLEEQQKRQRVGGAIGGPNSPFTPPGLDFPDRRNPGKDLPKIEKSGVTSPFTAAGQAPDWRNPGKDLPFDTLDPVAPGANLPLLNDTYEELQEMNLFLRQRIMGVRAENKKLKVELETKSKQTFCCKQHVTAAGVEEYRQQNEENARLRKEIKRRDEVDSLQFPMVQGILNAAASWTRGWIAGDSSGVSQDLCQAVLDYWKHMGIDPPREPVDRTQSPDAKRYEVQQKHIAHLNLQLDSELKRHRVSVDRLREIKRIVQDV